MHGSCVPSLHLPSASLQFPCTLGVSGRLCAAGMLWVTWVASLAERQRRGPLLAVLGLVTAALQLLFLAGGLEAHAQGIRVEPHGGSSNIGPYRQARASLMLPRGPFVQPARRPTWTFTKCSTFQRMRQSLISRRLTTVRPSSLIPTSGMAMLPCNSDSSLWQRPTKRLRTRCGGRSMISKDSLVWRTCAPMQLDCSARRHGECSLEGQTIGCGSLTRNST